MDQKVTIIAEFQNADNIIRKSFPASKQDWVYLTRTQRTWALPMIIPQEIEGGYYFKRIVRVFDGDTTYRIPETPPPELLKITRDIVGGAVEIVFWYKGHHTKVWKHNGDTIIARDFDNAGNPTSRLYKVHQLNFPG